jgi:hypothetical protein
MRSSTNAWAVRCFLRDVPDLQMRYQRISEYLEPRRGDASSIVGFRYIETGIKAKGSWYPIVVMDWVEGLPLDQAIGRAIERGETLTPLLENWLRMDRELRSLCVAHGDLQHGNVLVSDGTLRLVDYDGMFVPTLTGQIANEEGHPNYQHPARSSADYGEHLDRFSSLLIYTALSALNLNPDLWAKYQMPDDALLFKRKDLLNPSSSQLFNELLSQGDANLAVLVRALSSASIRETRPPTLDELLKPHTIFPDSIRTVVDQDTQLEHPGNQQTGGWWKKVLPSPVGVEFTDVQPQRSWLDRLKPKWWRRTIPAPSAPHQVKTTDIRPLETQQIPGSSSQVATPSWIQRSEASSAPTRLTINQEGTRISPAQHVGNSTAGSLPQWMNTIPGAISQGGTSSESSQQFVASSMSYKYHLPTCEWAGKIASGNRRTFASTSAATRAGYAPCKVCRPERIQGRFSQVQLPANLPQFTPPPQTTNKPANPPTQHHSTNQMAAQVNRTPVHPKTGGLSYLSQPSRVEIGSIVKVAFSDGTFELLVLVKAGTRKAGSNQVAEDTPMGRALVGARIGDQVAYTHLGRRYTVNILSIR